MATRPKTLIEVLVLCAKNSHNIPPQPVVRLQEGRDIFDMMADAVGFLYNATGDVACFQTAATAGPAAGGDLGRQGVSILLFKVQSCVDKHIQLILGR